MRVKQALGLGALCVLGAPSLAFAQDPPAAVNEADEAPDPARPPSTGKGVIWGVVTDQKTKQPVIEAQVTVMATGKKVVADLDGRYRIELQPGVWELRVWYEGYRSQRASRVVVTAGKVSRLDVALPPDGKVVEEVVEIDVTPDRASPAAQMELRKNAPHAGDAISAQEIARSPDRSAADAVRRIVGATVVDNKYVVVRGLGERYSNTLLNGVPLPSPEPDRQAVPLDIFPSLILSDINVAKTATPDMPADFAGGSVRIHTRELPREPFFQVNAWIGANTQATFANRLSYQGSSMDWLGIDSGARAFPSTIPDYKVARGLTKPDGSFITPEELAAHGRAINSVMTARPKLTPPNMRFNLAGGNTWKLGGGQEIGVVAAATYGRRFERRVSEALNTFLAGATDTLRAANKPLGETGTDLVTWGTFAGLTWAPDKNNKISAIGLHSRASEDEARIVSGFNEERLANVTDTRLRFQSRSLTFGMLSGTHKIPAAGGAVIDWAGFLSHATSDEPDTRQTVYARDDVLGVDAWDRGTQSGSHFWAKQRETGVGGVLDWTQPLIKGDLPTKLQAGVLVNRKSRAFDARRFRYRDVKGFADLYNLPADQLFTRENIGTALELEETTRPNDAYDASQMVFAAYVMADSWVLSRLRVTLGARVESAQQKMISFDPYAATLSQVESKLDDTDFLPSVNVVVKVARDMNLRLAASRTVARPQLRELAPFSFTDYFGAYEIVGNPDLSRTSIYNGDVRFEIFPGSGEVLAVSGFYKQFYAPIEQVILPSNQGITTYRNAESARLFGAELEVRKGLGFIHPVIRELTVLANLTLVSSKVTIDPTQIGIQTNNERPLQGQSPWVVNAGLDFSPEKWGTRVRVLYNIFGPRIVQVGAFGLPDVYERPRHQLDLFAAQSIGKHFDVKLTVENLLDARWQRTQTTNAARYVVNEYRKGVTVFLGGEYTY